MVGYGGNVFAYFCLRGFAGYGVATGSPAAEIDLAAAGGAEGAIFGMGGFAANGTGAHTGFSF